MVVFTAIEANNNLFPYLPPAGEFQFYNEYQYLYDFVSKVIPKKIVAMFGLALILL